MIRLRIEQQNLIGINSSVVLKIEIILGKNIFQTSRNIKWLFPNQSKKQRRYDACISKIKGEGAKEKKNKISKQLSQCKSAQSLWVITILFAFSIFVCKTSGYFHNYKNKLFNGKPTLRCGAVPFLFIVVVLKLFGGALGFASGIATKAVIASPKSFTIF